MTAFASATLSRCAVLACPTAAWAEVSGQHALVCALPPCPGTKFAVATGAKSVCVCTYEEANNWWVAQHLKEHRSTVLSVSWHPNSQLLVTGCCDFKARVVSATIKGERCVACPLS